MDDFKYITSKTNIISISSSLQKVLKSIKEDKAKAVNEIELIKSLCKSDNPQICLLASQSFIKLVEDGMLETSQVLSIFMALLPHTNSPYFTSLCDGIFEVLLIDLKRRCSAELYSKYVCQFDVKPPQHPLILLMNKEVGNMLFFTNKIHEICNHHDAIIKSNSIEFLRPVFLHVFCNISIFPESKTMWNSLLKYSSNKRDSVDLMYEILSWSKVSSSTQCLYTNSLVLEALEFYSSRPGEYTDIVIDLCLYLVSIMKNYASFNLDPRTNLNTILSVLYATKDDNKSHYSLLMMFFAELMQTLSPKFIGHLMRIVRFMLPQNSCNILSLHMLLDGVIQWLSNTTFIHSYMDDMEHVLNYVTQDEYLENYKLKTSQNFKSRVMYFHPEISKFYEVCLVFEHFEHEDFENFRIEEFIKNISDNTMFCDKINLILRGLFMCRRLSFDCWSNVFGLLMNAIKINENLCFKMLIPILYKLVNETHPQTRHLLIQNLASLGAKDQVLSTLRVLSKDIDNTFCLDLYLRLWKAEPRTYPFLYNILKDCTAKPNEDSWEIDVAKAHTIWQICLINPQQHGADLLNLFSDILSRPIDSNSEVAMALAINAISSLCENHVVNIASTWKVLGFKFTYEKRTRVVKSLCKFFEQIPYIKITTLENEKLFIEIVQKLWNYVTDSDDSEMIEPALTALKHFSPLALTLKQIPEIFRHGIEVIEGDDTQQIPGECWIQLMQSVNFSSIDVAGDLVAHHIYEEMETYRGGVYLLPEGRPEPASLKYLPKWSILAALVSHLIRHGQGSRIHDENELVLTNMLKVLSKKYPKPIPPLNWCFLHEYFHYCFEMKKYCFIIAVKQMQHSGTAKRLIENFLYEIVETTILEGDVVVLFEVLKDMSNGCQIDIFRKFIKQSLQVAFDISEKAEFKAECLLEKLFCLMKPAIDEACLIEDNLNAMCESVESYFNRLPFDSQVFQRYIELVVLFPKEYLSGFTKPNRWDDVNVMKLRKAIRIQCEIYKYNKSEQNPLLGLTDLVVAVSQSSGDELQLYLVKSLVDLIHVYNNEKNTGDWIIGIIGQIQTIINQHSAKSLHECLFLIDVFMTVVIVQSGLAIISTSLYDFADLKEKRLTAFPYSLYSLYQQNLWRNLENRIYEFLYFLYNHQEIPHNYAESFKNALICCKNQTFFQQPKLWAKFVCMRK